MTRNNTYHEITREEFEANLEQFGDFHTVRVPNTKELVYEMPAGNDRYTVRAFSTLDTRGFGNEARDVGNDAIRVVVWDAVRDRPVRSATRTNRIKTWAKNFNRKVEEMFAEAGALADDEADEQATEESVRESLPEATGADDEVVVGDDVSTQYGVKVELESPFAAKDAIKTLDWDKTHRSWDPDAKAWTVDRDSLAVVRDALALSGWTLVRPADDADDAFDVEATLAALDLARGDRVTVTYESKNSGSELTKSGVVSNVAETRVSFRRDDDQLMFVTSDGLFTAGSHFPFVGEVVAIDAE